MTEESLNHEATTCMELITTINHCTTFFFCFVLSKMEVLTKIDFIFCLLYKLSSKQHHTLLVSWKENLSSWLCLKTECLMNLDVSQDKRASQLKVTGWQSD